MLDAALQLTVNGSDCAAAHGSIWRDDRLTNAAGSAPVVLTASGEAACLLHAEQADVAPVVIPGSKLALSVTFQVNNAFRCTNGAAAGCPTITFAYSGSDETVSLVIDEALAARGVGKAATVLCGATVPAEASDIAGVTVAWEVPGEDAAQYGGQVTILAVALVDDGAHGVLGSTQAMTATSSAMMTALTCSTPSELNAHSEAAASCDAIRAAAIASAGASFVATAAASFASEYSVAADAVPNANSPTPFRHPLPRDAVAAGDRVAVMLRAIDAADKSVLRGDAATGAMLHSSGVRCVSGQVVKRAGAAGSFAAMATIAVSSDVTSVAFEARAASGSTLDWQLTSGDCNGNGDACDVGSIVATGTLAQGVLASDGSTTCSDASVFCAFSVPVSVTAAAEWTLWLQPSDPEVLSSGARLPGSLVYTQRVHVVRTGSEDVAAVSASAPTSGEAWLVAGECTFGSVDGGALVEYTAHVEGSGIAWESKLQNAGLARQSSGLCTLLIAPHASLASRSHTLFPLQHRLD